MYIATSNPGKLRDFAHAAANTFCLEPLPRLASIPAPREDASTFDENARTKAIFYSLHAPGAVVLADDSGLEVDALGGAPGVRSARFADDLGYTSPVPHDPGLTPDSRNNAALLNALWQVPAPARQARFRCVLAAARDGHILRVANGTVDGLILFAPQGEGGFGYDPLFYLPAYGKSMAELDPQTRVACSHRGRALKHLLTFL